MSRDTKKVSLFGGVDRIAVLLYLLLVLVGIVAIFSASWVKGSEEFFSFSHNYVKQVVWVGISIVLGIVVLLIDHSVWHKTAYFLYAAAILALLATLLLGRPINGARAWLVLGPLRLQTMEFAKIAIALAVARLMSEYGFSISSFKSLAKVAILLFVPLAITVLQNDTGSGLVLCSLLFMLYREGLNKWLCIPILFIAALFLLSFLYSPTALLVALLVVFTLSAMLMTGRWRECLIYLAGVFGCSTLLFMCVNAFPDTEWSFYNSLLTVALLSMVGVGVYAFRTRIASLYTIMALFITSVVISPTSNALFNVLKEHQRRRIMTFLGIIKDVQREYYNVYQSQIAIGSGGFWGKGYLQGSQIRYGLVPERHTDFIFCTIGEEFGFVGAMVVLVLMALFILRLMRMGDNQRETFGRVYCYSVASFLLFHTLINVGMTIGLIPVMGIPLPLISYGGSSMMSFTIMIFIAFALDAQTKRELPAYRRL